MRNTLCQAWMSFFRESPLSDQFLCPSYKPRPHSRSDLISHNRPKNNPDKILLKPLLSRLTPNSLIAVVPVHIIHISSSSHHAQMARGKGSKTHRPILKHLAPFRRHEFYGDLSPREKRKRMIEDEEERKHLEFCLTAYCSCGCRAAHKCSKRIWFRERRDPKSSRIIWAVKQESSNLTLLKVLSHSM